MNCALTALILVVVAIPVKGQSLPSELKGLLESGAKTVESSTLTEAQRNFLWSNTTGVTNAFFRVSVPDYYVNQISEFFKRANEKSVLPATLVPKAVNFSKRGLPFAGTVVENKDRTNLLFGTSAGRKMMFTIWNYENAGARLAVVDEFLNQKVFVWPATLSLAVGATANCLWKLTWLDGGVSYELYIEDTLNSSQNPAMAPEQVLEIAMMMVDKEAKRGSALDTIN